MVSILEQMQVPNWTGPGVRRSKRPLLARRTRCNVLWKPPKFGNKVKRMLKFAVLAISSLLGTLFTKQILTLFYVHEKSNNISKYMFSESFISLLYKLLFKGICS